MKKKRDAIKITLKHRSDLSTDVTIGSDHYYVETDRGSTNNNSTSIVTRIYRGGEVLSKKKTELEEQDAITRLDELMEKQHQLAINVFKEEKLREAWSPTDYLNEVKRLLRGKSHKKALMVLTDSIDRYQENPFLLSCWGCLEAIIDKNYKDGIGACQRAINLLEEKVPFGQEFYYPTFYLNLARAYYAADRKKESVDALNKGLKADGENADLLSELEKLGIRRKPVVPLLKRSNPMNKYTGMLLHKLKQ